MKRHNWTALVSLGAALLLSWACSSSKVPPKIAAPPAPPPVEEKKPAEPPPQELPPEQKEPPQVTEAVAEEGVNQPSENLTGDENPSDLLEEALKIGRAHV